MRALKVLFISVLVIGLLFYGGCDTRTPSERFSQLKAGSSLSQTEGLFAGQWQFKSAYIKAVATPEYRMLVLLEGDRKTIKGAALLSPANEVLNSFGLTLILEKTDFSGIAYDNNFSRNRMFIAVGVPHAEENSSADPLQHYDAYILQSGEVVLTYFYDKVLYSVTLLTWSGEHESFFVNTQ